jgi:hypothetical protein
MLPCFFVTLLAQEFRGGEIHVEPASLLHPDKAFKIGVDLYFKDRMGGAGPFDSIIVFTGDGAPPRAVQVGEVIVLNDSMRLYRYGLEHTFIGSGTWPVGIVEPFQLEGISNLEGPFELALQTDVRVFSFPFPLDSIYQNFDNLQTDFAIEGGVFRHRLSATSGIFPVTFGFEHIFAGQVEPYSLPSASNSVSLDPETGEFVWDAPLEAGKYLLAFELLEGGGGISKRQRFMIVEISESDLPTRLSEAAAAKTAVRVFPNPASERAFISLGSLPARSRLEIRVYDSIGRLMSSSVSAWQEHLEIDTASWGGGIYFITIRQESELYAAKLIKR